MNLTTCILNCSICTQEFVDDCDALNAVDSDDWDLGILWIILFCGIGIWVVIRCIIFCIFGKISAAVNFNLLWFLDGVGIWWAQAWASAIISWYFYSWRRSTWFGIPYLISFIQTIYVHLRYFCCTKQYSIHYTSSTTLQKIFLFVLATSGTIYPGMLCMVYSPPSKMVQERIFKRLFSDCFLFISYILIACIEVYFLVSVMTEDTLSIWSKMGFSMLMGLCGFMSWGSFVVCMLYCCLHQMIWKKMKRMPKQRYMAISVVIRFSTIMYEQLINPNFKSVCVNYARGKLQKIFDKHSVTYKKHLWYSINYCCEMIDHKPQNSDENKGEVKIIFAVEWQPEEDNNKPDEMFNFKYYITKIFDKIQLQEQIVEIYGKKINELLDIKVEIISDEHVSDEKDISVFLEDKYDQFKNQYLESYKKKISNIDKPLHHLSNDDIKQLICVCILNDEKYTKYSIAVANALINDVLCENGRDTINTMCNDVLTSTTRIDHIYNIFGSYIEHNMIIKLSEMFIEKDIKKLTRKGYKKHKTVEEGIDIKMSFRYIEEQKVKKDMDIKKLIEMIWQFPINQINKELLGDDIIDDDIIDDDTKYKEIESDATTNINEKDEKIGINGKWVEDNLSDDFVGRLHCITGMNLNDIEHIHQFLIRYKVPTNDEIKKELANKITLNLRKYVSNNIEDIINDNNDELGINYEELALMLKNHHDVSKVTAQLTQLIHRIIVSNHDQQKKNINYALISNCYEVISSTFSSLFLQNWWCSNCWFHNKTCKIGNKLLNPSDDLMLNCIVCGMNKIQSIEQTLRNKINHQQMLSNNILNEDDSINCNNPSDIDNCAYAKKNIIIY
eukprot:385118_1